MAGLRRRQREANGFQIAQLTYKDNVRILAKCGSQRLIETQSIPMHFTLVDQRLLAFVDKFDRIFNGQDMIGLIVVDVVNHRGQRRRLAGTGGPRHENDTAGMHGQVFEYGRGTKIIQRQDLRGDSSENSRRAAILVKCIHTKTRQLGYFE